MLFLTWHRSNSGSPNRKVGAVPWGRCCELPRVEAQAPGVPCLFLTWHRSNSIPHNRKVGAVPHGRAVSFPGERFRLLVSPAFLHGTGAIVQWVPFRMAGAVNFPGERFRLLVSPACFSHGTGAIVQWVRFRMAGL